MTGRVTIHDVARAAGVSTTTVSNALSGTGRVATETRLRVSEAADRLGYSANPSARGLRKRRFGAIGLCIPGQTFGLEYYMELSLGAAAEALAHGLALTLVPPANGEAVLPPLHVDGVVVSDPVLGDPLLPHLSGLGLPVVTCERDLTPGAHHAGRVESDHDRAVRILLDHLAESGATRIALLCPGPESSFGLDIRTAYLSWCFAAGHRPVVHDVPFASRPEDVRAAVERALGATLPPDAVVSVPDGGAASALQEVLRDGRRVPDEVLVASYVDSPSLRGLTIPITAVDIAPREMGRRAAELLAGLLAGTVPEGTVETLPTELVVRASTTRR
jgi:DNA-binding LacI/PurR family transcriptional regulator